MPRKITYKKRGRKSGGGLFDWLPNPFSKPNTSPGTTPGQAPTTSTVPVSGHPLAPVAGGKRKTKKNKTKKSKK